MSNRIDFTTLTACGECCGGCSKKADGLCRGCIEMDGYVPEWAQSGRCKVHACARKHGVPFCGLCDEFPCGDIQNIIHWKSDVIQQMKALADGYKQHSEEIQ